MCIQVLRILSLSLNLNTSKFPIFLNSFTIMRFFGLIGISSHAFVERKRGGSGWMMPEGFHQLLRRSFVVDILLFSVFYFNSSFFYTSRLLKHPQRWKFCRLISMHPSRKCSRRMAKFQKWLFPSQIKETKDRPIKHWRLFFPRRREKKKRMKRPSSFNGLLVMASLIMAQMGVSVESHPLQRRLDHWASPMTESEDHARPSRSTRDINDNLVRNLILETFHTVFSRRFPIWFPPTHIGRCANRSRLAGGHLFALALVFISSMGSFRYGWTTWWRGRDD